MYTPKHCVFAFFFLVVPLFGAFAEEKRVTLGGQAGWPALSVSTGLSFGTGRLGQQALVLSSVIDREGDGANGANAAPKSASHPGGMPRTDLYLSFDSPEVRDETGTYAVVSSKLLRAGSSKARRGAGSALCNTNGAGLVLRGAPGSLFSTPGFAGSFSVEFWLYPSVTENGSVLLQWRSSRVASPSSIYQYVRASIFNNHLEWTFSNIWTDYAGKPLTVTIKGRRNLIPAVWSHHELSYDSLTGMLEYCLDGSTESIQYLTASGSEGRSGGKRSDVYPALFGAAADLEIAPRFSGLIDEFRVSREPTDLSTLALRHAVMDRYPSTGGRFVSQPIDAGRKNSSLKRIEVDQLMPAETGTAFFVRSGDTFYEWTDSAPAWLPVEPGKPIPGITGRYFQVAGELYPDGRGSAGPVVSSVSVIYEPDTPPWPPARVFADAGDGSVTVSWVASIDFDTAGYLVYYGERPGEYLGSLSPIDTGRGLSCTVTGLKNGRLYYFCVAAYDASGPKSPGELSSETSARPLAVRAGANPSAGY